MQKSFVVVLALGIFACSISEAQDEGADLNSGASNEISSEKNSLHISQDVLRDVTLDPSRLKGNENEAYYAILAEARKHDANKMRDEANDFYQQRVQAELAKKNPKPSPFVDVFRNRELYHGKLVTLTGRVRRLVSYAAGDNEHGIKTLYDVWLYTDNSQTHPSVFVCTDLPEGLKSQMGASVLIDNVTVTGYFFKMLGYHSQDGPRAAPMFLAVSPQWAPPPPAAPPVVPYWLVYSLVAIGTAGAFLGFWFFAVRDDRSKRVKLQTDPIELTAPTTTE